MKLNVVFSLAAVSGLLMAGSALAVTPYRAGP